MKRRQTQPRERHSQRRPRNGRFRLFVALSIANAVLLLLILMLLPAALRKPDQPSFLGLRSIVVVGNTKYDNDSIIGISGMRVGQSVFSIKKKAVETTLESAFSYIADARVEIAFNRVATIHVTEAKELGAVYAGGGWMVVDTGGKGLMRLPIESERPMRRLYLKGAQTVSREVGKQVLSDRSLAIVTEISEAFAAYNLGEVNEIDMSNINNIRVNWKNQIVIALGNDSNLTYEIAVAAATIPKVLDRHGASATGVLNISQYADPTIKNPQVVFTPSSSLD